MGGRWIIFACLEAKGTIGGIIMLLDIRVWKGEILQVGDYTITCSFEALLQNYNCHISGSRHQIVRWKGGRCLMN